MHLICFVCAVSFFWMAVVESSISDHSCATLNEGGSMCWGSNSAGQIGISRTSSALCTVSDPGLSSQSIPCVLSPFYVPSLPQGQSGVKSFSLGQQHTCCLAGVMEVLCWGRNSEGQVGNGGASSACESQGSSFACVLQPFKVQLPPVLFLNAGGWHSCAAVADAVYCWGWNVHGQVANSVVGGSSPTPSKVLGLPTNFDTISLSCGAHHTCVVSRSNQVWCWGRNDDGQLGDGSQLIRVTAVSISSLSSIALVAAGHSHTCAVTLIGTLKCWGDNTYGQIGLGFTSSPALTPRDVPGVSDVIALCVGGWHSCVLSSDGRLRCWGRNDYGQVGLSPSTTCEGGGFRSSCMLIPSLVASDVAFLSAGQYHTCASSLEGVLMCWGRNDRGQLGDASVLQRNAPSFVVVASDYLAAISFWDSSRVGKVTRSSFKIFPANSRVAGTKNVTVVVSFKLSSTGTISSGGGIRIEYPDYFFKDNEGPSSCFLGSSQQRAIIPVIQCSSPRQNVIAIITSGQSIPAGTTISITLTGITLGSSHAGGEVKMSTSSDPASSLPLFSGTIGGFVSPPVMQVIGPRVTGADVGIMVSFTTSNGGPIAPLGSITLNYPPGFFRSSAAAPNLVFFSPPNVFGSASPPGSDSITFTITRGQINGSSLVNISVFFLKLGSPAADAQGIVVTTSSDSLNSTASASGPIAGSVTVLSFYMTNSHRMQLNNASEVVFSFMTSPGGDLREGSTITLQYPPLFFVPGTANRLPLVSGIVATSSDSNSSCSCITITNTGTQVYGSQFVTITLSGLATGPLQHGHSSGIRLTTSSDVLPSSGFDSGRLYSRGTLLSFSIDPSLRTTGAEVDCVISFSLSSPLFQGDTITLQYPVGFFEANRTPSLIANTFKGACDSTTDTSVIMRITSGTAAAGSVISVTLSGLVLGAATAGSPEGVTISTSLDVVNSLGVASGPIGHSVSNLRFDMPFSYRVAHTSGAAATISFNVSRGGMLNVGSTVTVLFPKGFFASSTYPNITTRVRPRELGAGSVTFSVWNMTSSAVVCLLTSGIVSASDQVELFLSRLTIGPPIMDNPHAIQVITSSDRVAGIGVSSGSIGYLVANLKFDIAALDRIHKKTSSSVTFSFVSSVGGALGSGSTVTLDFPSNFFNSNMTPAVKASSGLIADVAAFDSSSIALLILSGTAPPLSQTTFTLSGMMMGAATYGSANGISARTSSDQVSSAPVASGPIESYVESVSFVIATSDRVSMKPNVTLTLSFKTTKALPEAGDISLSYPLNFFRSGESPVILDATTSTSRPRFSSLPTSDRLIVLTNRGPVLPPESFSISIGGLTIGTSGAHVHLGVTVVTSTDKAASFPAHSGFFNCSAGHFWAGEPLTCVACPVQTYQPVPDSRSCEKCLFGYISPPGSSACQLLLHDELVLVLSGSIDEFQERSSRRERFMMHLAQELDIPEQQIVILSIKSGSIIIEIAFLSEWFTAEWPFNSVRAIVPPALASSRLQSAAAAGKFDSFGLNQLKVGGRVVYSTQSPPSAEALAAYIAGSLAAAAAVLCAAVWVYKHRSSSKDNADAVPDSNIQLSVNSSDVPERRLSMTGRARRVSFAMAQQETASAFQVIDAHDLVDIRDVGPGVQQCQWKGSIVLLKRVSGSLSSSAMDRAAELARINHPHCSRIVGFCSAPEPVVVEECTIGVDLLEYLLGKRGMSPSRLQLLIFQMCSAVQCMHSLHPPVIHSNIQLSSIILSNNLQLAQLTLSSAIDSAISDANVRYAAPERLSGNHSASSYSDMYSLGIVLYELLCGEVAWMGLELPLIVTRVLSGLRPEIPKRLPPALRSIIVECWAHEPWKRLTASTLWVKWNTLRAAYSRQNEPLSVVDQSFQPSNENILHSLRNALSPQLFRSVMLDMPIIDEYCSSEGFRDIVCRSGLTEVEARCIVLFAFNCGSASEVTVSLRSAYDKACCSSDQLAIQRLELFSFHLLSALQKLVDAPIAPRAHLYAACRHRLHELHDAYSVEGAIVCWHYSATVYMQLSRAQDALHPLQGGTLFEICGFNDVADIGPFSLPMSFIRERQARRCIAAFYSYKHRRITRSDFTRILRQWSLFRRQRSTDDSSSSVLIAQHNSTFRVQASLTCQQAAARGLRLPQNVDLVILQACPNPLPPSAMLSAVQRQQLRSPL